MVIFGHSNSGKTPLGDLIEQRASSSLRTYHHLDFGEHLRRVADGRIEPPIETVDRDYVREVLDGRLLDDAHFHVARAIVACFLQSRSHRPGVDILVLNGLPRHTGQARSLERAGISTLLTVYCRCGAQDALARKRLADAGVGHEDRSHRADYALEVFARKVRSFEEDTLPVLAYYEERHVPSVTIDVAADTTPLAAFEQLALHLRALAPS